ncbi:MAG: flippase-like domain-containing protein [Lachnospiraceae bacterium]|nr:flippase-like domain-containing protein [Lachnospiraceae bacterium]
MKEKSFIKQNKNKIICFIVTLLLAAFTIYAVFSGGGISFDELMTCIKNASWPELILAMLSMLGFIYFEGEAIRVIVAHMGYPTKRSHGFVYSAADVYFSAITPSASGGQPASAFFMMRDGMPGAAVMTALLVNLIMYTLAVVTIGLVDVILFPKIFLNFTWAGKLLIIGGGLILLGFAILFYLLLKKPQIIKAVGMGIASLLRKLRCHKLADKIEKKMESALEEYGQCVEVVLGGKSMMVKAYILNLLQRLSQIVVTLFTYMAMHGEWHKLPKLFATQIYVVLGSNCVPIPGGVGVADYLMLKGYKQLMTKGEAYRLEILSRGISFYVCMIISMVAVAIGYIVIKRKKSLEKRK